MGSELCSGIRKQLVENHVAGQSKSLEEPEDRNPEREAERMSSSKISSTTHKCLSAPWFHHSQPVGFSSMYFLPHLTRLGLPRWSSSKGPACQCRGRKRHSFSSWVRKTPWRRAWQPTPVFLPGDSHGQRSLACYSL